MKQLGVPGSRGREGRHLFSFLVPSSGFGSEFQISGFGSSFSGFGWWVTARLGRSWWPLVPGHGF